MGIDNQSAVEKHQNLMNEWQTQSKNDKEFGGDKFDENLAIAKQSLDKFGNQELKTLLNEHGIGNHPDMIRFMLNVGKLTKEDNPVSGTTNPSQKRDDTVMGRMNRMYKNN